MASTLANRRQPARLSFEDGEVVVMPRDRDVFLISAEKAIEACRHAVQLGERLALFQSELLIPLHDWCIEHAEHVKACYIGTPGNRLKVFIVTKTPRFDFVFGEKIAALEVTLFHAGWRVGVMQLPEAGDETLSPFLNPDGALEIYAQPGPTPQESGK